MKTNTVTQLRRLNQTMLQSLKAADEKAIIKKFLHLSIELMGADFGFAWYKSDAEHPFEWIYKTSNTPYEPAIPRKRGVMAWALRVKRPVFMSDVAGHGMARQEAKRHMRSVAVIPMTYQGKVYGNLAICYKKKHVFTAEEQLLCELISNTAAQAITINNLYSRLRRFKDTLDHTRDCIFMFDPETLQITYVNRGAISQVGFSARELFSKKFMDLLPGLTESRLKEIADPLKQGLSESEIFEAMLQTKSGVKVPTEIFLQYVPEDGDRQGRFLSIVRDITERKRAEETIKRSAYFDALTDVPNRTLFTKRLQEALDTAQRTGSMFALLFTDLDKFKFINDVLGHVAGDKLLYQVAQRLVSAVKKRDTVSRMGGDEFIILLEGIQNEEEIQNVARRILEIFRVPFNLDGQEIYVNVSIGISIYPLDAKDIHLLLKNADIALHRAKEEGGASYQQYHTGISGATTLHLELEKQLRHAIRNNELVLYYQPQVDLSTGEICSAEALLRWKHPTLGLMYPGDFLNRAEESGVIVQMGEWTFKEVARQNKEWQEQGLKKIPITINLSPRQLLQPDLIPMITDILKDTGLETKYLELELTESMVMKNVELSISVLEQFRSLGIRCLIDDFGTGYASLSYLKRLPIDTLKIDKAFVHGITTSTHDAAIIKAVMSIAHHMKLKVVAEGVETKKQLEFLHGVRCDIIQGNLYCRPVPAIEFANFLRHPKRLELPKGIFHLRNFKAS